MICDRCGQETLAHTGSMFNTDQICLPCKDREEQHPRYAKARDAELEAVKSGDYNYPGIGLPADLRGGG
jgi:hypothetical protein